MRFKYFLTPILFVFFFTIASRIGICGIKFGGIGFGPPEEESLQDKLEEAEEQFILKEFKDPSGKIKVKLGARTKGKEVEILAEIKKAPKKSTFKDVFFEDRDGRRLYPYKIIILELWETIKLTVSWTKTKYVNGKQVWQQSGGWSESYKWLVSRDVIAEALKAGKEIPEYPPPIWERTGEKKAKSIKLCFRFPENESPGNFAPWDLNMCLTNGKPDKSKGELVVLT